MPGESLGPVQVLVVGFEEPTYSGEVLAELARLEQAGIVRLIDLLLVAKTDDGSVQTVEDSLVPAGYGELAMRLLGDPPTGSGADSDSGSIDSADSDAADADDATDEALTWSLADAVPNGQAAAVALIEHTWASSLRDAILRNGGRSLDETWLAPTDHALLESLLAAHNAP